MSLRCQTSDQELMIVKSRYCASQTQRRTLGIGWTVPVRRSQLDALNKN